MATGLRMESVGGSEVQLAAQRFHTFMVLFRRQRLFGTFGQRGGLRHRQFSAVHHPLTQPLVVSFEHGEGHSLGATGKEKPVTGEAGVVHRRVTPALGGLRAGRAAGFHIGAVGVGQPVTLWITLTGANHPVERGQKLRLLDDLAGTSAKCLGLELGEAVQPELFDLVEYLGVAVGLVVLIVIVDAKQRECLVQGVDVCIGRGLARPLTGPSFGR